MQDSDSLGLEGKKQEVAYDSPVIPPNLENFLFQLSIYFNLFVETSQFKKVRIIILNRYSCSGKAENRIASMNPWVK